MDLKEQIQAEIAKTNDQSMRTMLLLILGVLESTAEGIRGLGSKLDAIYSDEHELRLKVLNGHSDEFDENMRWVTERRGDSEMDKAMRAWFAQRLASGGYCDKMAEQIADAKDTARMDKESKRRLRDAFIERLLGQVLNGLVSAVTVITALVLLNTPLLK